MKTKYNLTVILFIFLTLILSQPEYGFAQAANNSAFEPANE